MFSPWRCAAAFAAAFAAGMLAASLLTAVARPTGRQIVAFKQPQTPEVVRRIAHEMHADIVQIAPSGAYVVVVPRKRVLGASAGAGKGKNQHPALAPSTDPRIEYIEPEVMMGVEPPAKELLLVVPIKRIPPQLLDVKAKR